ncbi:hypothetical protein GQ44DRAFT_731679 [Phaeosphaeriaceae sp. PMI808]|nr:hypothetical protein GQ44DRAFT_731679 [Phaeosphaeriaceae sp. PMI808]
MKFELVNEPGNGEPLMLDIALGERMESESVSPVFTMRGSPDFGLILLFTTVVIKLRVGMTTEKYQYGEWGTFSLADEYSPFEFDQPGFGQNVLVIDKEWRKSQLDSLEFAVIGANFAEESIHQVLTSVITLVISREGEFASRQSLVGLKLKGPMTLDELIKLYPPQMVLLQ